MLPQPGGVTTPRLGDEGSLTCCDSVEKFDKPFAGKIYEGQRGEESMISKKCTSGWIFWPFFKISWA